jgi:hypothetical protein
MKRPLASTRRSRVIAREISLGIIIRRIGRYVGVISLISRRIVPRAMEPLLSHGRNMYQRVALKRLRPSR